MNFQLTRVRLAKLWRVTKSMRLMQALIRHRVLAGVEHKAVLSIGLAVVVDVGANRGQFALAVRQWEPKARVISFEPLAGPAKIFREVFLNDEQVALHQFAIGPDSMETVIHVSGKDDSSSLLPITELQNRLFPGTTEKATAIIHVAPLHALVTAEEINSPALLKLDVQGFEIEALRGCEQLLRHFDYVYAECSFVELYAKQALADQVVAYLRERGFRLSGVYNMAYDRAGKAVQGDFLFERCDR